jgi:hypothetical protein
MNQASVIGVNGNPTRQPAEVPETTPGQEPLPPAEEDLCTKQKKLMLAIKRGAVPVKIALAMLLLPLHGCEITRSDGGHHVLVARLVSGSATLYRNPHLPAVANVLNLVNALIEAVEFEDYASMKRLQADINAAM